MYRNLLVVELCILSADGNGAVLSVIPMHDLFNDHLALIGSKSDSSPVKSSDAEILAVSHSRY